jgi:uncharacterized protein YjbI with pentapeptide repeats
VADLREARLGGALLVGASLRGADLRGAYLRLAKLDGTNLSDANLDGSKGLTQDQRDRAHCNPGTKLPAGLTGVQDAKNEHVAMLGRGAAAWNTWRAESGETPDLSLANLRGLDLSGFDLSHADLRGADLRERNSATRICQVSISRVRTSSKRCSTAPILPGLP